MIRTVVRDISFKYRLILIMMLTSGIALVMTAAAFLVNDLQEFRTGERQKMTALAEMIARNTKAAVMFNDDKAAKDTLAGLSSNPHVISAHVVMSGGSVLATYRGPHQNSDIEERTAAEIIDEARAALTSPFWKGHEDMKVAAPIILDNQEIGLVAIRSDLRALRDRLSRALVTVAGVFIAAVLIAYLVALRLQQVISEPILHLADTMKSVSRDKDYALRARSESNDEIGLLMKGFNEMLGRIQQRDEELERFTAELKESNEELKAFMYSAAHDLRQPLVNIKGFTSELAQSVRQIHSVVTAHADRLLDDERARIDRRTYGHGRDGRAPVAAIHGGRLVLRRVRKRLAEMWVACRAGKIVRPHHRGRRNAGRAPDGHREGRFARHRRSERSLRA